MSLEPLSHIIYFNLAVCSATRQELARRVEFQLQYHLVLSLKHVEFLHGLYVLNLRRDLIYSNQQVFSCKSQQLFVG